MFIEPSGKGDPKKVTEKKVKTDKPKKTFVQKDIKPLFSHFKGGTLNDMVIKASQLPDKVEKDLKPIKKVSDKRAIQLREYNKKRDEYLLAHWHCEFQGCKQLSTDLHHLRGRVGRLLTDERYFKAFCREHHTFVELNPKFAKDNGYSLSRLSNE